MILFGPNINSNRGTAMNGFKQFIESEEEDDKPVRIKLRPWPTNPDSPPTKTSPIHIKLRQTSPLHSNSIPPETFINIFNKEMKAQPVENKFYYEDGKSIVIYSMSQFQDYVYISDLSVEPRGIAAIKFLSKLTTLADKHSVPLVCISKPLKVDNEVDPQRLTNLYKKFGFKHKSLNSDNLVRLPK